MLILGLFMMHFNLLLGNFSLALSLYMAFRTVAMCTYSPTWRAHSDYRCWTGSTRQPEGLMRLMRLKVQSRACIVQRVLTGAQGVE
jgi:hypothetical protein